MSEITLFKNPQFGKVRVIMRGNDPWFVAKDVAVCLGYTDPKRAIYDHCKKAEVYSRFGEPLNIGGVETTPPVNSELSANCSPLDPQTKLIPESDLYRLIMRSHLPATEAFQDWVVEEVLPAIRKTGRYSAIAIDSKEFLQARHDILHLQVEFLNAQSKILDNDHSGIWNADLNTLQLDYLQRLALMQNELLTKIFGDESFLSRS